MTKIIKKSSKTRLTFDTLSIRRRNCIDAVRREAKELMDGLAGIAGRLERKRQATQRRIDAIMRFKSQFRDYMLDAPRDGNNPAIDEIKLIPNGHFATAKYKRELFNFYDSGFKEKTYSSIKLQQTITRQRDAVVKMMKDDIRAITTDDFVLALHRNGERRNNVCKYVYEAFRDFVQRMLKDDGIKFDPSFPAEEAEAIIRSIVERLQIQDLKDGFFVNVDAAASRATVSVRKLNDWRNLLWEFRKRNADEAKAVFTDYFNPTTETGPFAELIEAVADKIRGAVTTWLNENAYTSLRDEFIKQMDKALLQISSSENDTLSVINQDCSITQSLVARCNDVASKINQL